MLAELEDEDCGFGGIMNRSSESSLGGLFCLDMLAE